MSVPAIAPSPASDWKTVPRLTAEVAAEHPQRAALVLAGQGTEQHVSYGELQRRIDGVRAGLAARGVARGDRVLILVPMSEPLYVALMATLSLGAVAVFVEAAAGAREIMRAAAISAPKAFIGVPRAHALRLLSPTLARIPVAVSVGRPVPGAVRMQELACTPPIPAAHVGPDEPALLTFSSGTTGTPKGAVRSHGFLLAQHAAVRRLGRSILSPQPVELTSFPIVVLSCLAAGATAILPRIGARGVSDVDGAELVALVQKYGATSVAGSPAFLSPLVAAAIEQGVGLSTVHTMVSGGAPVPLSLCDAADESVLPNGEFRVVYGSTEAEPISTINASLIRNTTGEQTRRGAGLCVGRPVEDIELRVIAPVDGAIAPGFDCRSSAVGAVGEIIVSGPHVNERYYNDSSAEQRTKIDSDIGVRWHRTGDAGYVDAVGRVWIVGRIGDRILLSDGGEIYPSAVEALVQEIGVVARAALVRNVRGDIVLVVEPRTKRDLILWLGSPLARRRFKADIRRVLAARGVQIDRVQVCPRLPTDVRHRAKIDQAAVARVYGRRWARWIP